MANLIRLKQIESGSALTVAASVNTDFSQSVIDIVTAEVGGILPDGLISSSTQVILQDTFGNLSGSKIIGDIQATAIEYTNILNKPTLVSGSTQVVGILDSLNQFTSSLDNTFATDAELAITTSNLSVDMGEF